MAEGQPKLGFPTKFAYGLGSVAFGIKDGGFGYFLLFFYSQVVGLSAALVGLALMIALVADAVFDPLIGEISDNWRSRLGRRHPFMYGAAVPVAFFYFLLWNPPHWSGFSLFAYLLVVAISVRVAIACYEIPSSALAPELSPDYDQRTSLMAYRWLLGALGNGTMLAIALTFFMVATKAQPTGMLNRSGYFSYSIVASLVMLVSILLSARATQSRIPYMKQIKRKRPALKDLLGEMFESLSHRSFLMITVGTLVSGMAVGLGNSLNSYLVTYFWRFTPQQAAALGLGALIAAFLGFAIAPVISRIADKRLGFILTAFSNIAILNTPTIMKLFGLLPPDGSTALLAIFFSAFAIGGGLALASGIIATSMIADIVEDSELKTGRRTEGLFFASLSFAQKSVSGVGGFFAGIMLTLLRFPQHASASTVDPHIVRSLVITYVPIQIALWVVACSCIAAYRIDRQTHDENVLKLAEAAALAEASNEGALDVIAPRRDETSSPVAINQPAALRG